VDVDVDEDEMASIWSALLCAILMTLRMGTGKCEEYGENGEGSSP